MPNPTTKTRQAIKNRFVRNAIPTQADFADLIDASLNQADDGLLKLPNEPLGLVRQQPDKPVLRFYDSPDATGSVWQIQLSADNKASADSKAGFALVNTNKDGATSTRLFLDAATGNVGIGTTQADARLTVQGGMQIADTVTIGGRVDMLATSNPIRFSSTWTGFPDDKTNGAEISNDVTGYKTLMIIGNKSAGGPRSVSIWDVLNVNGILNVKSTLTAIGNVGIGTDVPGSKLHIVHSNQGPGGNTLILGPTNQSNLRLGYDEAYSWIQSHGSKPLAINSIGSNVGIGTANPLAKLQITGNVSIVSAEGQSFACKSNYMAPGSLTIGGLDRNYGGGNNGWNTNTAGLLLEALDNTEIAIHDSGVRLASFMYYEGAKNQFTIGRDMGFGAISAVNVQGALQATKLNIFEATGTAATASAGSLLLDHNDSGGASSIVFRSKVNQGSDYAFLEYRDQNPNINDSEAGLLTIGIQNDGNDNIALMPSGNVGIGTDVPGSKLHIVHSNQGPGGNTLILGPTNQSNLRLGYDEAYSWIQSHGSKPLAINSIGNNVGIGTANPLAKLQITGNVSIVSAEGQNSACKSNYMAPGSLTIGGIDRNYGGGNNWNSSTAGLLLEALDNTEIAIHDSGVRLASFMYYEGAKNQFTIGRDMGWGAISAVNVQGSLQVNGQTNILTGSNPVRFSSNWTCFPDDKTNGAEISNDTGGYKTLMIVGNRSNGGGRRVSIWDILEVNGTCMANGSFQVNNNGNAFKIDTLADRAIFTLSKAFHGPGRQISWDGDNNWDQYSDETLKTNIHIETGILPRLLQIDVKSFQWKDDLESNKRQLGFIAQDVRLAFPNLIKEKPFGEQRLMSLNYTNFGILAVGAIKELNAIMATEIQELRVELDRLKQQVGD